MDMQSSYMSGRKYTAVHGCNSFSAKARISGHRSGLIPCVQLNRGRLAVLCTCILSSCLRVSPLRLHKTNQYV